jgi:hypothetical protein
LKRRARFSVLHSLRSRPCRCCTVTLGRSVPSFGFVSEAGFEASASLLQRLTPLECSS